MTRLWSIVVVVVIVAAAVIAYAPARASYARHAASRHLRDADVLLQQMPNPVVQQSVKGAADELQFTLMNPGATTAEIITLDAALVDVMARMRSSPPPERPVYLAATYDSTARAGQTFHVRLTVHADVPQAFLVAVTAEFAAGTWRGEPAVQRVNRAIGGAPVDVDFAFAIPAGVSGQGQLRVSGVYRLDPSGEGADIQASSKTPLPAVTVER